MEALIIGPQVYDWRTSVMFFLQLSHTCTRIVGVICSLAVRQDPVREQTASLLRHFEVPEKVPGR